MDGARGAMAEMESIQDPSPYPWEKTKDLETLEPSNKE